MGDSSGAKVLSSISDDRRRLLEARMSAPPSGAVVCSQPGFNARMFDEEGEEGEASTQKRVKPEPRAGSSIPAPAASVDEEEIADSMGSFSSASNESILSAKDGEKGSDAQGGPSKKSVERKRKRAKERKLDQFFAKQDAPQMTEKDRLIESLTTEAEKLRSQLAEVESAAAAATEQSKTMQGRFREALTEAIRTAERCEREQAERELQARCERLGRVSWQRAGTTLHETWEDGRDLREVEKSLSLIKSEREDIEKQQKDLNKLVKKSTADTSMPPPPVRGEQPFCQSQTYLLQQSESLKIRLTSLKKKETETLEKKDLLESEKALAIREIKRQRDENASSMRHMPILHERYLLTRLLGRGGFSEVYKSYDLKTLQWVACKIHMLQEWWSEEKKNNYVRHATREYDIHKSLEHPRVVQLTDVFEIDRNSFCTVLEYCSGCDLDEYLRIHKVLTEREARSVISQVVSGLLYLNQSGKRIIHYDLKPGNILVADGQVKITDFGLSKQMEDTDDTAMGMELTSQGAGTYWYLPPECFHVGSSPPRISAKVDVWSAGVILYQMLYGKKPFGHDQSQERILREGTILREQLVFPTKPNVSPEAKTFIQRCLIRDQQDRPDIVQLSEDPFVKRVQQSRAPITGRDSRQTADDRSNDAGGP